MTLPEEAARGRLEGGFARSPRYEVELNPELSGTGAGDDPVPFGGGSRVAALLEIHPQEGSSWLAEIWSGGLRILGESIWSTPNPDQLAVHSDGAAYVIDARTHALVTDVSPVTQLFPAPAANLLLIADFTNLIALGENRIAWTSERLCWDDLRILGVTDTEVLCEGTRDFWVIEPFTVDIRTGESIMTWRDPSARKIRRRWWQLKRR